MPLHRFQCRRCDHTFEEMFWPSETATAVQCPSCDSDDTERAFGSFRVRGEPTRGGSDEMPFCGRCGENRPPCSG